MKLTFLSDKWDRFLDTNPLTSVERACSITEIIASFEYLSRPEDRRKGGLNDWSLLRVQFPDSGFSKLWNRLDDDLSESIYATIQYFRIVHNVILLLPVNDNKVRAWCNAFLSFTHLALQPRNFYGTDGSDQLSFLGNTAIAIGRIGGTDKTKKAASDFLALQLGLSYFIAGAVKVPGAKWHNGDALQKIMGTETYGDKALFNFLKSYPWVGRLITRGTVILETLFPLTFIHRKFLKSTLFIFALFHLANARFMGLGRFVLPFISMYPAIWSLRFKNNSY